MRADIVLAAPPIVGDSAGVRDAKTRLARMFNENGSLNRARVQAELTVCLMNLHNHVNQLDEQVGSAAWQLDGGRKECALVCAAIQRGQDGGQSCSIGRDVNGYT